MTEATRPDKKTLLSAGQPHSVRLGNCEVCGTSEALYSCPKCELKTCSLRCVHAHKKELQCNGIRDRSKFIALREMSKGDFLNDYYLLEEATRFVQNRKHDKIKHFTHYNKCLPTHKFRLRQAALQRDTKLHFLLQNFTRHRNNTSYYDWKNNKIHWRVEWMFVSAGNMQYVDERCAEDKPLLELLRKYVDPQESQQVRLKRKLECYHKCDTSALKLFLKAEGIKQSVSRYHSLDMSKSLRDNLAKKTLVEYPSIYVYVDKEPLSISIIEKSPDDDGDASYYHDSLNDKYKKLRMANGHVSVDSNDEKAPRLNNNTHKCKSEQRKKSKLTREGFQNESKNFLFSDENMWALTEDEDDIVIAD